MVKQLTNMCKKGSQKILKNKFGELEIKSISLHPLSQTGSDFWRTKKSLKKIAKKFGKNKKGSTFAAPKNETGIDSKASDERSEEKREIEIEKGREFWSI